MLSYIKIGLVNNSSKEMTMLLEESIKVLLREFDEGKLEIDKLNKETKSSKTTGFERLAIIVASQSTEATLAKAFVEKIRKLVNP